MQVSNRRNRKSLTIGGNGGRLANHHKDTLTTQCYAVHSEQTHDIDLQNPTGLSQNPMQSNNAYMKPKKGKEVPAAPTRLFAKSNIGQTSCQTSTSVKGDSKSMQSTFNVKEDFSKKKRQIHLGKRPMQESGPNIKAIAPKSKPNVSPFSQMQASSSSSPMLLPSGGLIRQQLATNSKGRLMLPRAKETKLLL